MLSKLRDRPFRSIFTNLKLLYDISVTEDEFIEISLIGWNKIGNRDITYNEIQGLEIAEDNTVELPCDYLELLSVSAGNHEDYYSTHRDDSFKDSRELTGYIIPYDFKDKYTLQLKQDSNITHLHGFVNIIYKTVKLDEEQLPLLNEKELDALVKYCVYIYFQRQAHVNPKVTFELVQAYKTEWERQCANARVRDKTTANFDNSLFKTLSARDLKQYNKTYRLYKNV